MIELRKLNGTVFAINAELIESVESGGDTLIHLTTGNTYVVKETMQEVLAKVTEYRRQISQNKKSE